MQVEAPQIRGLRESRKRGRGARGIGRRGRRAIDCSWGGIDRREGRCRSDGRGGRNGAKRSRRRRCDTGPATAGQSFLLTLFAANLPPTPRLRRGLPVGRKNRLRWHYRAQTPRQHARGGERSRRIASGFRIRRMTGKGKLVGRGGGREKAVQMRPALLAARRGVNHAGAEAVNANLADGVPRPPRAAFRGAGSPQASRTGSPPVREPALRRGPTGNGTAPSVCPTLRRARRSCRG